VGNPRYLGGNFRKHKTVRLRRGCRLFQL
jgi:hypothetical protein